MERVEQAEKALAGDAEHARHIGGGKRVHDRLATGQLAAPMGIGQLDTNLSSIRTVASRSLGSIISNAVCVYRVGIPTSAVGMPAGYRIGTPSLP